MHESERSQYGRCSACEGEVAATDRVYLFGQEELLCFECALERHGVYDEADDCWTVEPEVSDLLERVALDG